MKDRSTFVLLIFLSMLSSVLSARSSKEVALEPYSAPPAPASDQWSQERLMTFTHQLTDYVYQNMVVKDTTRATYGKTYEFFGDGRQYEVFALDSMHDGAWFANAMLTAHRVWPGGRFLERALTYQIPFYLNIINNSHILFPNKVERQDNKPLQEPLKGWVPRGWSDGWGWCFATHTQYKEMEAANVDTYETKDGNFMFAYGTPSNHLAQDLADLMLDVWMTTKDPECAEAAMNIRNFRNEYFGEIAPIEFAAGVLNDKPEMWKRFRVGGIDMNSFENHPYYSGAYQLNRHQLRSDNDGLAFDYQKALTEYFVLGELPMEFVFKALVIGHGSAQTMEMYFDDRPYPYGIYKFDLQAQPYFLENGKLSDYMSTSKTIFGGRGIQLSWITTALLPALKSNPNVWEMAYRQFHGDLPLIRIVDCGPITNGLREAVYDKSESLRSANTTVSMISDPKHLHIFIESGDENVTLEISHAGPTAAEPPVGVISADKNGVVAHNQDGDELLFVYALTHQESDWSAEIRIPYSYAREQNPWINGVDNGRYMLLMNGGSPKMIYMLSEPERMIKRFEDIALGTIQTWYDIWMKHGAIPSGWPSPLGDANKWTVADSGNFAHLIKLIAYWQIYQNGDSEWQLVCKQRPKAILPAKPLPPSVIKAQMEIKQAD